MMIDHYQIEGIIIKMRIKDALNWKNKMLINGHKSSKNMEEFKWKRREAYLGNHVIQFN